MSAELPLPNDLLPHPGAVPRDRILPDRRLTATRAGILDRIPADTLPDTLRTDLPTRHGRTH
ncbi:hypothetical protein VY88_01745 [Azospirillum thiophilum]|uniref:Uncharacterized protein n=1 Tax=Azospirillum thiophilum TaxID=528244 RepID=A0AAC8VXV2_9PROT|nr:hypothetical protein AL072_10965 [Azospirillum thiophilum]KJR65005.1 hypothetical protein VY88_01745 [Azospirillum thiophilum]